MTRTDEQRHCNHHDVSEYWELEYEIEPPNIRVRRECSECHKQEEYILTPDSEEFEEQYTEYKEKMERGEIAHVSLQIVEEMSDGTDAYAYLTIERGEGTGVERVGGPYYFYY